MTIKKKTVNEGTYKVEIEGLPKMYMDTDNPGELRRDLRKIVRKVDMVKNVERVQKSQVRKDLQLKIQGKDEMEEMTMGQGVEIKKTAVGDRPKGIGWSLKKSGQQTGKDHDVWHRVTKPVAQPKIRAGSPMYSSKNESFFFVAEDQIKKDGAKIKKAYAAIATEDMNVITKHLKKQGIDHDHDKGELYVRRQDHRDVMNHLNDLMKKKMIKSKPPVTAEKLDKDDEPFIKNLIKNLRKGSKTHGGQADDLEKAMKESVTQTPGDSYHHLQKAKRLASADGHDYDKLPKYHRGKDVPHQAHYDDKAKNEARGVPRKHAKTYSNLNLKKARELMSPAKHRQDGIDRIAKGMGISKAKAAKHHDDVMKSYGFKPEGKAYGPTGVSYYVPKGHPNEVNPKTREKYPERQTDKYKADYAKNSPLKLSGKFSKNEAMDPVTLGKMQADAAATQRSNQKKRDEKEKKDMAAKLSPKAQRAKDAQARIDKKFAPGGSYSKGADQIRKVIAKNESVDEIVTRRGKPIFQPKPGDSPERTAMIKSVQKSLNKRRERLAQVKKDRAAAYKQGKDFDVLKALGYGKAVEANEEKKEKKGLAGKAQKSGMPLGILRQVYNRGMAAWKTGHRKGTTPQQWAMARVNSFVTKSSGTWGKADKDLAAKVRAAKK